MSEYYQIVYCWRPPHRVWRRQIRIVAGGAVVADGETLLPEKVRALEKQAGEVMIYRGQIMIRAAMGAHGCIFCGNTGLLVCSGCGRILCGLGNSDFVRCHLCGVSGTGQIVDEEFMPVSRSGYTGWRQKQVRHWGNGSARELRAGNPMREEIPDSAPQWEVRPEPEREAPPRPDPGTAKLLEWLEERKKKS